MNVSAMLLCDFYKVSHRAQYPEGTQMVYSTWTPRISRHDGVTEVVHFGPQAFIKKYLIEYFDRYFFSRNLYEVLAEYRRVIKHTLNIENVDAEHITALHDLGYLPLEIRSLPEGTLVPLRTPVLTIQNTNPEFFWLTNYIESLASAEMWKPSTTATIAHNYRKLFNKYSREQGVDTNFCGFQGHDFSFRGMSGLEDSMGSGAGHLLSFVGTDSIPSICFLERYYGANIEKELVGTSIPATEHSVMCANGSNSDDQELAAFNRLISQVYPTGFVSIVSDTRDFWNIVDNVVAPLKAIIKARPGRVVIRPDSGNPADIIAGTCREVGGKTSEEKGLIERLWEIFGGTETKEGFKVLDSHIGAIYGEAITLAVAKDICERLAKKGFAAINCVYGIGSYTYQFNTRDTYGYAYKSTACQIKGDYKELFKNPKTDDGSKKSQRGRVAVFREKDGIVHKDQQAYPGTPIEGDLLQLVFRDGKLLVNERISDIRARLAERQ